MDKMKWASAAQRVVMLVVVLSFSAWVWAQERNVTLQIKDMRVEQVVTNFSLIMKKWQMPAGRHWI